MPNTSKYKTHESKLKALKLIREATHDIFMSKVNRNSKTLLIDIYDKLDQVIKEVSNG
jgi:hypothetical protein